MFIDFNPCFTIWVYHGVFTELFTLGCFKDVYSLSNFTTYLLSAGRYLDGPLGVFTNLVSLGILLKCLEDTSEEARDADCVYVVEWKRNLVAHGDAREEK